MFLENLAQLTGHFPILLRAKLMQKTIWEFRIERYIIEDMAEYDDFIKGEYHPPVKRRQETSDQSSPLRKAIERVSREKKQKDLVPFPELDSLTLDDILGDDDTTRTR